MKIIIQVLSISILLLLGACKSTDKTNQSSLHFDEEAYPASNTKLKSNQEIESLSTKNIASIAATSAGVSKKSNSSRAGKRDKTTVTPQPVGQPFSMGLIKEEVAETAYIVQKVPVAREDPAGFSGEGYEKPTENQFVSPVVESHSTFSLDVDKASYSNVRRFINNGQLPPPAAVRVEELVNYFDYDYEQPNGKHPIAIKSSNVTCPWNKEHQLLHLSVKAQEVDTKDLPASNLVFLLDVSGSMRGRLPLVKESFELLLDNLRPQDRVAIVTYAGNDRIVLASTPASEKQSIIKSLNSLQTGGGTAGAQGIKTAYKIATDNFIKDGNNRVILATDGDFNVGVSSAKRLESLITQKRETGVFLSVLGFGIGNYQDHKMQTLANKGNGNHAYIDNIKEAKKVFVNEFGGTLFTVAKDVKVQIEFNPAYVQSYRLIGYENRMLAKEDFIDDKKDAGEVGAGHTVTAIYEIIPTGSDSEFSAVVSEEQWAANRSAKQASKNNLLGYVKCRYKQPDADKSVQFDVPVSANVAEFKSMDKDVQFSIAVAEFGMNVGKSTFLKSKDLNNCIELAKNNLGIDAYGYRKEFLKLAKSVRAKGLLASK